MHWEMTACEMRIALAVRSNSPASPKILAKMLNSDVIARLRVCSRELCPIMLRFRV